MCLLQDFFFSNRNKLETTKVSIKQRIVKQWNSRTMISTAEFKRMRKECRKDAHNTLRKKIKATKQYVQTQKKLK